MKRAALFQVLALLISLPPMIRCAGQTNQTIQNGAATVPIVFPAGCSYSWTCDHPEIGLSANGSGNIASFTAINTGTTPITATITATPTGVSTSYAYIPSLSSSQLNVINTSTNTIVATISTAAVAAPDATALSPDGTTIYITGYGGVDAINTSTNTATNIWSGIPGNYCYGVVVSPDGSTLYVVNNTAGTLIRVDVASGTATGTVGIGSYPLRAAISPDGTRIYTIDQDGSVNTIDLTTFTVIGTLSLPGADQNIVISPDGKTLYTSSNSNIYEISTVTNTVAAIIPFPGSGATVNLSPDGSRLYLSQVSPSAMVVINTATRSVITSIPVAAFPNGAQIDPATGHLYVIGYNNIVTVIDPATNTVVTTITVPTGNAQFTAGNFIKYSPCAGISITKTIIVNPSDPTISAGPVSGVITTCAGAASVSPAIQQFSVSCNYLTGDLTATAPSGFEISLLPGSGFAGSQTLSPAAGTVGPATIYVRAALTAPTGNISGNVVLSSPGATSQDIAVTGTVTSLVTPSIAIAASDNNICAGVPVSFSATPSNQGSAPIYQWAINGAPVGTNSPGFASSVLNNGDQVSCQLISNMICVTTATATSTPITMQVSPLVTPAIAIATSDNNICAGAAVSFSATPSNQGSTPIYQWTINGAPVGTNSTGFTSSTLNNGDQVSCILTSSASCLTAPTAVSNLIPVTVTPLVTPSVTVTPSLPEICAGTAITFTAAASNAGSPINYQWAINGADIGTNTARYTSTDLHAGDEVVCTVTSNQTCAVPTSSAPLQIPVNPLPSIAFPANPVYKATMGIQLVPYITGTIAIYQWSPGIGLSSTDIADPIADPINQQTYQLQVTTDKGCIATAEITVIPRSPLALPSAFTPNGDGHNDLFRIPTGAPITLDQFVIYDRWGAEVFSTRNAGSGWDGTKHGIPASAGTYVYIIRGKNAAGKPISINGTVMLVR